MSDDVDRRGGISFWLLAVGFVGLIAIMLAVGLVIHRRYVAFERIAARHVPPDATLVVRWDVEKVVLFEPTRRFLLPLLDASDASSSSTTRRDRLEERAELQIGRDLREVLVAFGPAETDWAVVLAGSFPEGNVFDRVAAALADEDPRFRRLDGERIALPGGALLGRAPDGAFVVASTDERLRAAMLVRAEDPAIARTGAGSLAFRPGRGRLPSGMSEVAQPLSGAAEVTGRAEWGNPLWVELRLELREPEAQAAERLRRVLTQLLGPELGRLEQRFGTMRIEALDSRTLHARLPVDSPALERAAERLASTVSARLALRPARK